MMTDCDRACKELQLEVYGGSITICLCVCVCVCVCACVHARMCVCVFCSIDLVGDTVQLAKMARTSIDKVKENSRSLSQVSVVSVSWFCKIHKDRGLVM